MRHLLVVGEGLAGLFAANLAIRRGHRVTLIAQGRGGLSLSHGCLELGSPHGPWPAEHPYRRAGMERLGLCVEALVQMAAAEGLAFCADMSSPLRLPTAAGQTYPAHVVPLSMVRGDTRASIPTLIGGFRDLRDFDPGSCAAGLRRAGFPTDATILPLPADAARDLYSTDLARRFDLEWEAEAVAALWRPHLGDATRLGLPAVLGLDRRSQIYSALERSLGIDVFEIPTLPPSVPGLRLERVLREHALKGGCRLIEGPSVTGRVDGKSGGARVLGVVATTAGGPRVFDADAVLLASGGFMNGGLRAFRVGRVSDSVFDLPVDAPSDRSDWVGETLLGSHPYDRMGLRVNERMQPVDRRGQPFFSNLFVCGGVLAGADRRSERSRQGIDLVTADAAVEAASQ